MHERNCRHVIFHVRFLACAAVVCLPLLGIDIQGTVVSAMGGRALQRAEVVLRPIVAGGSSLGVTTDENGRFAFTGVAPAQYALVASRPGFLSSTAVYQHQARMVVPFALREDLTGVSIRLQPAATIAGKVRHAEGEAAPGIVVQAYREVYQRKRHFFEAVARALADDRGEYRLFGLAAGRYYVAALFAAYGGAPDVVDQPVRDAYGQLVVPERTVTTFAASAYKLAEATPIVVTAGAEVGTTDIFLARTRTAVVKGKVLSGADGAAAEGASIALLREDATGTAYFPSLLPVQAVRRGEFEIRGVMPGRYILEATHAMGQTVTFARQPLVIGNAPEVTANLLLLPEVTLTGTVLLSSREESMPSGLRILAEPRGGGATRRATFVGSGNFALRLTAGETYDLVVESAKGDTFAVSAKLHDGDVLREGLRLEAREPVPLLLTVSQRGASIQGQTLPGANVLLLARDGILARHSETAANEWGAFGFSAVAPGEYRVLAWFDDPPCEIWSPMAATECARFGTAVSASGTTSYTVVVQP